MYFGCKKCCGPVSVGPYCMSTNNPGAGTWYWNKDDQQYNVIRQAFHLPGEPAPPQPVEAFYVSTIDRNPTAWTPPTPGIPLDYPTQPNWGGWVYRTGGDPRINTTTVSQFPDYSIGVAPFQQYKYTYQWFPAQASLSNNDWSASCNATSLGSTSFKLTHGFGTFGASVEYSKRLSYRGLGLAQNSKHEPYPGTWFDWLTDCVNIRRSGVFFNQPTTVHGHYTFTGRSKLAITAGGTQTKIGANNAFVPVPNGTLIYSHQVTFGMRQGSSQDTTDQGLKDEVTQTVFDAVKGDDFDGDWPLRQIIQVDIIQGVTPAPTSFTPWVNIDDWLKTMVPSGRYWWGFNVDPKDGRAITRLRRVNANTTVDYAQEFGYVVQVIGSIEIKWTDTSSGATGSIDIGGA